MNSWAYSSDINPYLKPRPTQTAEASKVFVKQLDWTLGHKLPAYPLGSPFEQAQHYKSVAYAAIQSITRAVMGTQISLERPRVDRNGKADPGARRTDSKYVPFNHPLADILKHPNPVDTWSAFQTQWILQKSLHGRAIIWGRRNKVGAPIRLYIIPTPLATPAFGLGSEEYPVGAWRVQTYYPNTGLGGILPGPLSGSAGAVIDGREMYIDDNPHPLYRWTPYSPLVGMDTEFDLIEKIDRACWSVMVNGVIGPTGYFDMPGADEATINQARSKVFTDNSGAGLAGKPLFFGGGDPDRPAAKWNPLTPPGKDIMFGESFDRYLDFVLSGSFGIDRAALGMKDGGYADRYAAKQDVRERTYEPMLAGMANVLTDGPVRDWGLSERGVRVRIDLPMLQDPTLVEGRNRDAATNSLMSVNEIRSSWNMEPVDGGELPPKLYEQYVAKKAGLAPTPMDAHTAQREDKAKEMEAMMEAGQPPQPDNPQGEGSLPERIAPRMQKAMSAYIDGSGGTLVSAARKKRVIRLKRAKQALGCMVQKALAEA